MAKIAATDGGTYFHYETLHQPPFRQYFDDLIYLPDLSATDLTQFDALVVSCRSNPKWLLACQQQLLEYLNQGGTLVIFGDCEAERWLPGVEYHSYPVNFWWWLEPEGRQDVQLENHQHSLFNALSESDLRWHYHGAYRVPEGAEVLLRHDDGYAVLADDRVSWPGRVILTSLDPTFHHGSHFMPATTRFLHGFLPWLHQELDQ